MDSLTHGFFSGAINQSRVHSLHAKCLLLLKASNFATYLSNLHEQIPDLHCLVPDNYIHTVSRKVNIDNPSLMNAELHCMPSSSDPIPFHQDNFYHAVQGGRGFKFLIPLNKLFRVNGGLTFLDNYNSLGTLEHSPSDVPNFSSFIEANHISRMNLSETTYSYDIGDISYHLLNSIHYSYGNTTESMSLFVVLRYQCVNAPLCEDGLKRYEDNRVSHRHKIARLSST